MLAAAERDRHAPAAGPPRRARVDDVPRHDAREVLPDPRAGQRARRPASTSISPSRPSGSIPAALDYTTQNVPKVVGGVNDASTEAAAALYGSAIDTVHRVSSPEAAELTKLLENIFRSVNIALVNELAQLCDRMGIDVWEVIDAAATKPFGFMRFEPGPGLGGHCIPIDPFYLTWKAREYDFTTEFIELAGKVNSDMPYYCRSRVSQALNHGAGQVAQGLADPRARRCLQGGHLGHARVAGGEADRAARERRRRRRLPRPARRRRSPSTGIELASVPLDPGAYDAVVIATAHSERSTTPQLVADARLVVDLRNALGRRGISDEKVWKL